MDLRWLLAFGLDPTWQSHVPIYKQPVRPSPCAVVPSVLRVFQLELVVEYPLDPGTIRKKNKWKEVREKTLLSNTICGTQPRSLTETIQRPNILSIFSRVAIYLAVVKMAMGRAERTMPIDLVASIVSFCHFFSLFCFLFRKIDIITLFSE